MKKLIEISVAEVKHLRKQGVSHREIGQKFGVSASTILRAEGSDDKIYKTRPRASLKSKKADKVAQTNKALKAANGLSTKIEALTKALKQHGADAIRIDLKEKKVQIRYSRVEEIEL